MSAVDALHPDQFGGYGEFHRLSTMPVRMSQWAKILSVPHNTIGAARDAREAGDRPKAARLLNQAAHDRRLAEGWTHLKR